MKRFCEHRLSKQELQGWKNLKKSGTTNYQIGNLKQTISEIDERMTDKFQELVLNMAKKEMKKLKRWKKCLTTKWNQHSGDKWHDSGIENTLDKRMSMMETRISRSQGRRSYL